MAEENSRGKRKRSRLLDSLEEEGATERCRQRQRDLLKHFDENPPLEQTDEDRIRSAKSALRNHIGADMEHHLETTVLFFIEVSPNSSQRGAACQHVTCKDRIKEGSYRIAVHPGMNNVYKSPDFYHVRCFENLVDFSQATYLDRIAIVTRNTAGMRGLKGTSIADGNYLLDGGSERLVLEWKVSMGRLMDKRDGVPIKPMDPDFDDLLHKSGSASYKPKHIDGMPRHEFRNLSMKLAPVESDGIEDEEEWNLFEQYLGMTFDDLEDLNEPHSLSDMLEYWKVHTWLACANEEDLNDAGKEEKKKLGEKAIRAIRRLSSIPMPDYQSAFSGRFC